MTYARAKRNKIYEKKIDILRTYLQQKFNAISTKLWLFYVEGKSKNCVLLDNHLLL